MYRILIVDDEQSVRYSFRKLLSKEDYHIEEATNADEAIVLFKSNRPHLVILDVEMPGRDGLSLLKEIKAYAPKTPVIIVTAFGSGDRVIKAMKYGAYEYIEKPFDIPKLKSVITEALKNSAILTSSKAVIKEGTPEKKLANDEIMVGESAAIKEVFKLIGKVAVSDASILIEGESGTGKELVARAIHKYSDRANRPFIAINCAAIPEQLLESELFGFERGAFTGAEKQKAGKFEEANNGTLFLDEIGDMSLSTQSKVLRVLQEGTLERVGGTKTIKVNARVVAATNRNLDLHILNRQFREDLYYRLKVITISLPPLRLRSGDIPLLVSHFLQKHSNLSKRGTPVLHPDAMKLLIEYHWPGNIRQLENVLKRAIILCKGDVIGPEMLFEATSVKRVTPEEQNSGLAHYLNAEIIAKEGEIYRSTLEELEKDLIKWALEKTKNNQLRAARILGISRVMLHERIEKFGLKN